jgi:hypothetical protein
MLERNEDPHLPEPKSAKENLKSQTPTLGVEDPYEITDRISCATTMAEAIQARWFCENEKLK